MAGLLPPTRCKPRCFRPCLEALEDRFLPATISWVNPGGGDWNVASNWSLKRLPNSTDDVFIQVPGIVVTHNVNRTDIIKSLSVGPELHIKAGTVRVLGEADLTALTLEGGTARFQGGATIDDFRWLAGTLTGSGTIYLGGNAEFSTGANRTLAGVTLVNTGYLVWSGGRILNSASGGLINSGGGTMSIQGIVRLDPNFINEGTLDLDAGKFQVLSFTQNNGATRLQGGGLLSIPVKGVAPSLVFNAGLLGGAGLIEGSVISSGTISPGGAGILTIAGNLTQNNGMIEFVIDGPPGSGDDQIQVTGTASISGTLSLVLANGYVPNNDTFTLLTAKLVTGQFALVQVNSPVPLMSNFSTTPGAIGVQLWFVQGNSTTNTNGTVDAATYNQGIPGENLGLGERASLLEGLLGTRSNSIASLLQADSILISGSLAAFARPLDRSLLSGAGGGMMGILGGMRTGGRSGGSDTIEGLALADDLFATLPLILPEVELPSEEQTLTTDDIAGALLVGGAARADILPQRGAQLAPVATLVSGEDDRPRVAVDETDAALAGLMINPLDRALDGPMELHLAEQEEVPRDAWRDAVLGWIALLGVAGCGLRRGELIRRRWIR